LFFSSFSNFSVFFQIFLKLNLPLFSFLSENYSNSYLDYYFYTSKKLLFINKILIYNIISSLIFKNYYFKNSFLKLKFYKKYLNCNELNY
jgi:hypothetical protein